MTKNYLWVDNPTEANVAVYDPDILNECLMHLKYSCSPLLRFCINSASLNSSGVPNLLNYTGNIVKFNCGNSLVPTLTSNSQSGWTLSSSHSVVSTATDIFKSFDADDNSYCSLATTPSTENPSYIEIAYSNTFSADYLYIKIKDILTSGSIKHFFIKDENNNIYYSNDTANSFLNSNEFLIPLQGFSAKKLRLYVTSNVNNANFVNFPSTIKILTKDQVVALTNAQNASALLCNITDLTITGTSGIQNIYIGADGSKEAFAAPLTVGKILPTSPTLNQVHYLTGTEPCTAKKYNGSIWEDYTKVPAGTVTLTGGAISAITTNTYNQNGYNVNSNSFAQNLASPGWIKLPNGLILQWGYLSGQGSVTFPIAFPNAPFTAFTGRVYSGIGYAFPMVSLSTTGMYVYSDTAFYWLAIGY